MEVYSEQIIDISLNAAGYIIAGGLWMLVYSAWQNRRAAKAARAGRSQDEAAPVTAPLVAKPAADHGGRSLEFVTFRGASSKPAEPVGSEARATTAVGERRRNRDEVFALARRMLEQGASTDAVKSELPVSDGELALLHGKY